MIAKKQQDISKETDRVKEAGKEAGQKALEVASFAERTKAMLESLGGEATTEAAQAMEQTSRELQDSIDRRQGEVFGKSQEIYDQLEKKQEGFEKAIAADRSDLTELNMLKKEAEAAGVSRSDIDRAGESKQEEINFLSASTEHIETVQDELKKKLDESRQRRQAVRVNYKSKSLHNPTQFVDAHEHTGDSSRERGGDSHTEYEPPLDSQVKDDKSSSERVAKEKAEKEAAEKAAKVAADEITAFNLKGGHGHADHGYQTTRQQHETRLLTGQTPTGRRYRTRSTSRFFDPQSERLAIQKAQAVLEQLPMPGQPVPQSLGQVNARGYVSFVVKAEPELTSLGESGRILTRNPDTFEWEHKGEAIFVFKPNSNNTGWELVTYFPLSTIG